LEESQKENAAIEREYTKPRKPASAKQKAWRAEFARRYGGKKGKK